MTEIKDRTHFRAVEDYQRKPGATKNIVICFDGTGGHPSWATQESKEVPLYTNGGGLSNITKLHLLAGGNVDNSNHFFDDQVSIYYQGVGTWADSAWNQGIKSAFGAGAMKNIYTSAYNDLKQIYQAGDRLYIFGFSRGAATARLFASYLDKERNKIDGSTPEVAFLGVFDTVVQSSRAGDSEAIENVDVDHKQTSLPGCVKRAVHLVSIDERREPFRPTLFNEDDRVTEVWCPGNHSDVGGGYYNDGLSDISLTCMKREAELAGMKTRVITEEMCKNADFTVVGNTKVKNFSEFDKDMKCKPDALDPDIHDENAAFYYVAKLLQFKWGFKHRIIKAMKDDEASGKPVLILDATVKRMKEWGPPNVPMKFQYKPYTNSKYCTRPRILTESFTRL